MMFRVLNFTVKCTFFSEMLAYLRAFILYAVRKAVLL
jgi:hypothetical protein